MTYSVLTPEQISRLRQYGAETPGGFPVADHAPPRPAPARLAGRPTYDAAALAEISNSIAVVSRGVAEVGAAFQRRQARATADAAREAVAALGRASVDYTRTGPIAAINARNAEVWGRKPAGVEPARAALPPGFTADAGLGAPDAMGPAKFSTLAAINARNAEVWGKRAS
ncbi:hypothetical protein [Methylobacterium radiotolerans]|uniref:Uncharacterized protein n=1 Tax=Methylobacterium radiotolerans (strain ATCC 27329 / DSM 1819 / JCM 2831 / NBRC 15690 / NCIMB 10815 / 0-1) TaxID=426355 RepID=B1M1E9_METRJ|nr:hypothetical protein [Methylobacterium radiotolerans]ACB26124.1 hypothetical protein Mrad2831_4155 [Methylobacterium radiotolerans JCM 2831]GEN01073.1 hypothetical protein MRA01_56120 [Methylobacterium radiotolerans]